MNGTTLIIGNSHLGAIAACAEARAIDGLELFDASAALVSRTPPALRADLLERVRQAGDVVSCVGGNVHSVLGLIHWNPSADYDFILPFRTNHPCKTGLRLVPFAALRGTMLFRERTALKCLAEIVDAAGCRVRHLLPPPPPEWLEPRRLATVLAKVGLAREGDDPASLMASPEFRLKLWLAATHVVAAEAIRLGCEVVEPPAAALNPEGMLARRFTQDLTHGNAAYGELVLRKLGIIT